jgi:hypothetical protein
MNLETLPQTAQKLTYSAPKLSQLGSMQSFVLGGDGGEGDAGNPDFGLS